MDTYLSNSVMYILQHYYSRVSINSGYACKFKSVVGYLFCTATCILDNKIMICSFLLKDRCAI